MKYVVYADSNNKEGVKDIRIKLISIIGYWIWSTENEITNKYSSKNINFRFLENNKTKI